MDPFFSLSENTNLSHTKTRLSLSLNRKPSDQKDTNAMFIGKGKRIPLKPRQETNMPQQKQYPSLSKKRLISLSRSLSTNTEEARLHLSQKKTTNLLQERKETRTSSPTQQTRPLPLSKKHEYHSLALSNKSSLSKARRHFFQQRQENLSNKKT